MIDLIELSKNLINCPSVTPKDAGAIVLIEDILKNMGFVTHKLTFSQHGTEPVDNLYARIGSGSPNLCFAGHTDVVPSGDLSAWSINPFAAEIRNGMLIGRGATDMKPAIAAWVTAVEQQKDKVLAKNGSLSFLITGDEEDIAINGTQKVLEWMKDKGEKIDACIVGEPTNAEEFGDTVKIGRRGSLNFTLKIQGIQGHVAYPQNADNPITKLVKILSLLTSNKLDGGNEYFQPSNLEITSIDVGNKATNVIPALAVAKFNVRFNNIYNRESLINWVTQHCRKITDNFILEHDKGSDSFLTKPGRLSEIVVNAVKSVTGAAPEISTTGGTSDARFIKDYCPVVEFGLINKTAHKVDEQSSIEDIKALAVVYSAIISDYFS